MLAIINLSTGKKRDGNQPKSYAIQFIDLLASVLICQVTYLLIITEHSLHVRCCSAHFTYHLISYHRSMGSQMWLTQLNKVFIYLFGCTGLHDCVGAFSSRREQALFTSCGAQSSHCSGFPFCREQALEHPGFSSCGLSVALTHVESSRSKNQTSVPCIAMQILFFFFLTTGPPAKPWFTQFYRKKERLYFYLCPIPKPMCYLL